MRRKQHVKLEPRAVVRETAPAPTAKAEVGYPSLGDALRSPELVHVVRAAVRAAACVGLLGAAGAASGCQPPECQASRWGEVKVHGSSAVTDVGRLDVGYALDELGVGLGISPHPSGPAIAGEMMPVMPTPPVGSGAGGDDGSGSGGSGADDGSAGADDGSGGAGGGSAATGATTGAP